MRRKQPHSGFLPPVNGSICPTALIASPQNNLDNDDDEEKYPKKMQQLQQQKQQ